MSATPVLSLKRSLLQPQLAPTPPKVRAKAGPAGFIRYAARDVRASAQLLRRGMPSAFEETNVGSLLIFQIDHQAKVDRLLRYAVIIVREILHAPLSFFQVF